MYLHLAESNLALVHILVPILIFLFARFCKVLFAPDLSPPPYDDRQHTPSIASFP